MAVPEKSDSKITVQTQARSFARKVRIEFFSFPRRRRRRGWDGIGNRPEGVAQGSNRAKQITQTKNLTATCEAKNSNKSIAPGEGNDVRHILAVLRVFESVFYSMHCRPAGRRIMWAPRQVRSSDKSPTETSPRFFAFRARSFVESSLIRYSQIF